MSNRAIEIVNKSQSKCSEIFNKIDEIALFNQKKVLDAFRKNKISAAHLVGSTGYGYSDMGRDALAKVFADVFHTEAAIVSPLIASGTHALTISLFGLLRPNDVLLSVAGKPYDTLDDVISGKNVGSLSDFGISFQSVELSNGKLDIIKIKEKISELQPKIVFLQRSQGYDWRLPISINEISEIVKLTREISPNSVVMVDNCYGEFTGFYEPTDVGADVIIGSLIKNCGGGIAPTGAYIAGKSAFIEQIGYRFTASSVGTEIGSCISGYLPYYEGLFLAPKTVASALKSNVLSGYVLEEMGFETTPAAGTLPCDIIRAIKFNEEKKLTDFCVAIQAASPIDSYLTPEAWDMPGYNHKVIMSAGTFVQGSSLEMTADAPIKPPYIGYLQGALTYEHAVIALTEVVEKLISQ